MTVAHGNSVLLRVQELTVAFPRGRGKDPLVAVSGVSFEVPTGSSFGIVGESGSGKTTIARVIARLQSATGGRIFFDWIDLAFPSRLESRRLTREIQMVFQDPYASLNPRRTIGDSVIEPLVIQGLVRRRDRLRLAGMWLERVGLGAALASRYPHQLSGGQRQRVGIARAICTHPRLLILDEPVSSLDVSIQAQIINLLIDLRTELGLTYIFIAHNLALVRVFCEQVAVLKRGVLVELACADRLFSHPRHPYTRELLQAVPKLPEAPTATG